jgi:flavin-binding protein dodecin
VLPGEEGEDAAWAAGLVAVVEVIGARIVEVDGALDEAQAEHTRVEVEVALRLAGDGGDAMQPVDDWPPALPP